MTHLTKEEYKSSEKKQTIHRSINTVGIFLVVLMGFLYIKDLITPLYEEMAGITEQRVERQEISQILLDEGARLCQYKDSLGFATIGVGHLVVEKDMPKCVTPHKVVELLIKDYRYAKANVEKRYPWAEGEVKLILINMTFQLGENRLAKFTNTLKHLEEKNYINAAAELMDSNLYKQTPKRVERHVARILALSEL